MPSHATSRTARVSSTWVRDTWLLGRQQWASLLLIWIGFVAVGVAVGWGTRSDNAVTRLDRRVAEWFVAHRSEPLDRLSLIGSLLSDTVVKVVVTGIVVAVMAHHWERWLEASLVAVTLLLEAASFIAITTIVDRPRPDVRRLDHSPVGSSFPSGHVAAAVAYGAIPIALAWHHRRWIIAALTTLVVLITIAVAWSRMYRGMHHLSDVIAGVVLGVASVAGALRVVRAAMLRSRTASIARTPGTAPS